MWIVTCRDRNSYNCTVNAFEFRTEAERLYDLYRADGLECCLSYAIESANRWQTDDCKVLELCSRKQFDREMNQMADYYQWNRDTHSCESTQKNMV
jgi:hypothetical protein